MNLRFYLPKLKWLILPIKQNNFTFFYSWKKKREGVRLRRHVWLNWPLNKRVINFHLIWFQSVFLHSSTNPIPFPQQTTLFSGHRHRRSAVIVFLIIRCLWSFSQPTMDKVFNKLRNLDAYPKVNEDFYNRTLAGGVVTVVSAAVMLFLFISELSMIRSFFHPFHFLFYFCKFSNFERFFVTWLVKFGNLEGVTWIPWVLISGMLR